MEIEVGLVHPHAGTSARVVRHSNVDTYGDYGYDSGLLIIKFEDGKGNITYGPGSWQYVTVVDLGTAAKEVSQKETLF